tara:strand:- start:154670 stop:155815 length:1146 start_codon:yes stop_codon:yes gene_type:complete
MGSASGSHAPNDQEKLTKHRRGHGLLFLMGVNFAFILEQVWQITMQRLAVTVVIGLAMLALGGRRCAVADETEPDLSVTRTISVTKTSRRYMPFNVPLKTIGGSQVWTDYRFRDGYRLQRHALTRHWRVLDKNDVRRAWGNRVECQRKLDQLRPAAAVGQSPHYVILIHGLMRTSRCMLPLEQSLAESGQPNVIRYSYASTRSSMGDHAEALRELMEDLPADATFSFVGHSMGNIVVRRMIGDLQRDDDPCEILNRCKSMVMLGPPNQGASIARNLAPTGLYGIITGKGGLELGPQWDAFAEKLAIPPFPFVIVAGDVSDKPVKNPLVAGDGDFIVSLDEVELEGREALYRLPVLHSFLMKDAAAMKICVDFIGENSADQR